MINSDTELTTLSISSTLFGGSLYRDRGGKEIYIYIYVDRSIKLNLSFKKKNELEIHLIKYDFKNFIFQK